MRELDIVYLMSSISHKYINTIVWCQHVWNNVIWIPEWMCWSPQMGAVNNASIHHYCLCRNRSRAFPCCLPHYHLIPFSPLAPSKSVFCPGWHSASVFLSPGMNIERFDRLSLTWFSQLRWPNTLSMSTNLSTASINHWRLWRRTGWA